MRTRPARQFDVLGLTRLAGTPATSLLSPPVFEQKSSLVKSALLPAGDKSWLVLEGSTLLGFASARPRRDVLGWELTRLHVRTDVDREAVVSVVVHDVLHELQDRGIPRLFARTPENSHGHEALLFCGFTHLLSESAFTLLAERYPVPDETPIGMRYRLPQDSWPLRQLENNQTPLLVSQLEGLTSISWSMPRRLTIRKSEPTEMVVERDGELVAWVGWKDLGLGTGPVEPVRLGLLVQQDDDEMADALLRYALHRVTASHPRARIVIRLRDYQLPIHEVVLRYGFQLISRETLHIKHGRLQLVPKKLSRFFELAPKMSALALDPGRK